MSAAGVGRGGPNQALTLALAEGKGEPEEDDAPPDDDRPEKQRAHLLSSRELHGAEAQAEEASSGHQQT